MQQLWVPASKALSLITRELGSDYGAMLALCRRAHAGLLRSQAQLYLTPDQRTEDAILPQEFWWAEGQEALNQDWTPGDFSTWIQQRFELKAFGVKFDFEGLRSMMSPTSAARAARELSVLSDSNWVSARDAQHFVWEQLKINPVTAGITLIDHCKMGLVPGRAILMQRARSGRSSGWDSEIREWDVPTWFWENFTTVGSSTSDWGRGLFAGKGRAPDGLSSIRLTGVHFERAAMEELAPAAVEEQEPQSANRGGRPRKDWWDDLWCAVWGQAFRGDLQPKNQSDVERAMMAWVEERGETASESTIKPLARKMFAEMQR